MSGLRNTRVVGAQFAAHHAATLSATMTATIVATRPSTTPGQPTFDEESGRSTYPTPPTVYTGPARIQRAGQAATDRVVGERVVTNRDWVTSTPLDAALLQVNDVVEVTAADDSALAGRKLRVTDVRGGSVVWERDYQCEEWSPTTR